MLHRAMSWETFLFPMVEIIIPSSKFLSSKFFEYTILKGIATKLSILHKFCQILKDIKLKFMVHSLEQLLI